MRTGLEGLPPAALGREPWPLSPKAATFAPEMEGGEHSSRELTVSVKVPCQECGGLGYIQRVKKGRVVGDKTKKCRTCGGRGLIPDDMPVSQLRELLK